jgi:uncharacterized FlgJ-related protein
MLYTYCKKELNYKQIKTSKLVKVLLGLAVFATLGFTLAINNATNTAFETELEEMPYEEKVIIINEIEKDAFSQEALVEELKRLNIKFPHIVLAQAMIESGHFQSNIFMANNNLFGMKQARQRCTTAKGTNLNHAYYDNWKESVMDYALFQSAYLRKLKTEAQYLEYLDRNYAEAQNYDNAVKRMIEAHDLEELFNDDI